LQFDCHELAKNIRLGDRRALSKGITIVESALPTHQENASELLEMLMPYTGGSIRIGVSGAPGVGKSTFIESFGGHVINQGHKVAVLAVDPTSSVSGGSILGDKTRMESLSRENDAYIRPSPAGKTLGGVTRRTRETLLLCEAAGFDVIFVETVGVGQSETAVSEMTDMFLLLIPPGGGDELQGIKRGIMELADLVLVNKSDGDQLAVASRTAADYQMALQFLHSRSLNWKAKVQTMSALTGQDIDLVWQLIIDYRNLLDTAGEISSRRIAQSSAWMWNEISEGLLEELKQSELIMSHIDSIENEVKSGNLPPTVAARKLIKKFKK
jgi:LAO/AO transport system kinase